MHELSWASERVAAEELGRTTSSVKMARHRYGRYQQQDEMVCCVCRARPIWWEEQHARAMQMCKGCYLKEMAQRKLEEPMANNLRQRRWRERHYGPATRPYRRHKHNEQ